VQEGTEIEIVPEGRPGGSDGMDPNIFRATVDDLGRQKPIIWLHDGNPHSLTSLTSMLSQEHGVQWIHNKTYGNWRIVGHSENLWDEAERLRRQAAAAP
jgi:hypothetical protein